MLAPLIILIAGGLAFSERHAATRSSRRRWACCCCSSIAVALHGEMFRLRPAVGHLTRFYLAMSFGGMLGGLFCAIVAPLLFDWAYEHPLLIARRRPAGPADTRSCPGRSGSTRLLALGAAGRSPSLISFASPSAGCSADRPARRP